MGPEARTAIPKLAGLLLEPRADLRASAAEALGRIGPSGRIALPALAETLTDPDDIVRRTAAEALGLAGRAAIPVLRRACAGCCERVRVAAAVALERAGADGGESERVLRGVMHDGKNASARHAAAVALCQKGKEREAIPALALLLRDEQAWADAANTLVTLGRAKQEVRAFVRPLLNHEASHIRQAAWQVLEAIDPALADAIVDKR